MVSKASEDLPEPERPVMTVIAPRGMSTLMFLRLWVRAPFTRIHSAPRAWCSDFDLLLIEISCPCRGRYSISIARKGLFPEHLLYFSNDFLDGDLGLHEIIGRPERAGLFLVALLPQIRDDDDGSVFEVIRARTDLLENIEAAHASRKHEVEKHERG